MSKKIFFLDAYALIFRAYYAFITRPIYNSKGLNTSAIYGFVNTLMEVLLKEKPEHIAVVFDFPGPNFRHEIFPKYKANRDATPEDIKKAVPYIKEILKALNIPVYEIEGYEADDTIGTLAKKAAKKGYTVYMMTPDKDYGQLVEDNIYIYKPRRQGNDVDILDVQKVLEKFKIKDPLQVIDILGLWGDSSDNIPGAPGVGEKTAQKLIAEYGSIENLLENTDKLKGKQKEKIESNKEQILLSKKLATITLDVPIEFNEKDTKPGKPDVKKLNEIFQELEFNNIFNKIIEYARLKNTEISGDVLPSIPPSPDGQGDLFASAGVQIPVSDKKTIDDTNANYILVDNDEKLNLLIKKLSETKAFSFDTETTSTKAMEAEIVGISFAINENEAFYLSIDKNTDTKNVLSKFKTFLENEHILKIGQNLKYDIIILHHYNIDVKGPFFDTMIAHYLLEPEQRHNLDNLASIYLDYKTIKIEELIGKKGKSQRNMKDIPAEKVYKYACEDADIALKLKNIFNDLLEKESLKDVFDKIEMPLVKVLAKMEINGVKLDTEELKKYAEELKKELKLVESQIFEIAGHEFNIASPKQLGQVLFEELKVTDKPKLTKTKQYSTGEEVLEKLKNKHPIINLILEYRSLAKLISTYVEPLPLLVNNKTGRVHTSFNQAVASTGRLSSTDPNLQNIPIREERGRLIRKSFIATNENYVFFSADYSQIELRIMAHLSKDENLLEAFNKGEDIHLATAAKIFKKDLKDVTKEERAQAKSANFGIIYGISAFGLAENVGISRTEAKKLIENYFATYPKVKEYMDNIVGKAREQKYVTTIFGRKRKLPDIDSRNHLIRSIAERNAINAPIQGSSADIIKLAMINIDKRFEQENLKSKMIIQVHDELNFDVLAEELELVENIVVSEMENAVELSVKLTANTGTGKNWYEAH